MLVDYGMQVNPQTNAQKYAIEAEVTVKINTLTDSMFPEEAKNRIRKLMPSYTNVDITKLEIREITDTSEYNFADCAGNVFRKV